MHLSLTLARLTRRARAEMRSSEAEWAHAAERATGLPARVPELRLRLGAGLDVSVFDVAQHLSRRIVIEAENVEFATGCSAEGEQLGSEPTTDLLTNSLQYIYY